MPTIGIEPMTRNHESRMLPLQHVDYIFILKWTNIILFHFKKNKIILAHHRT